MAYKIQVGVDFDADPSKLQKIINDLQADVKNLKFDPKQFSEVSNIMQQIVDKLKEAQSTGESISFDKEIGQLNKVLQTLTSVDKISGKTLTQSYVDGFNAINSAVTQFVETLSNGKGKISGNNIFGIDSEDVEKLAALINNVSTEVQNLATTVKTVSESAGQQITDQTEKLTGLVNKCTKLQKSLESIVSIFGGDSGTQIADTFSSIATKTDELTKNVTDLRTALIGLNQDEKKSNGDTSSSTAQSANDTISGNIESSTGLLQKWNKNITDAVNLENEAFQNLAKQLDETNSSISTALDSTKQILSKYGEIKEATKVGSKASNNKDQRADILNGYKDQINTWKDEHKDLLRTTEQQDWFKKNIEDPFSAIESSELANGNGKTITKVAKNQIKKLFEALDQKLKEALEARIKEYNDQIAEFTNFVSSDDPILKDSVVKKSIKDAKKQLSSIYKNAVKGGNSDRYDDQSQSQINDILSGVKNTVTERRNYNDKLSSFSDIEKQIKDVESSLQSLEKLSSSVVDPATITNLKSQLDGLKSTCNELKTQIEDNSVSAKDFDATCQKLAPDIKSVQTAITDAVTTGKQNYANKTSSFKDVTTQKNKMSSAFQTLEQQSGVTVDASEVDKVKQKVDTLNASYETLQQQLQDGSISSEKFATSCKDIVKQMTSVQNLIANLSKSRSGWADDIKSEGAKLLDYLTKVKNEISEKVDNGELDKSALTKINDLIAQSKTMVGDAIDVVKADTTSLDELNQNLDKIKEQRDETIKGTLAAQAASISTDVNYTSRQKYQDKANSLNSNTTAKLKVISDQVQQAVNENKLDQSATKQIAELEQENQQALQDLVKAINTDGAKADDINAAFQTYAAKSAETVKQANQILTSKDYKSKTSQYDALTKQSSWLNQQSSISKSFSTINSGTIRYTDEAIQKAKNLHDEYNTLLEDIQKLQNDSTTTPNQFSDKLVELKQHLKGIDQNLKEIVNDKENLVNNKYGTYIGNSGTTEEFQNNIANDLQGRVVTSTSELTIATLDNGKQIQTQTALVKDNNGAWQELVYTLDTATGDTRRLTKEASGFKSVGAMINDSIKTTINYLGRVLTMYVSARSIIDMVRNGVQYVTDLDSALTEFQLVTNSTDDSLANMASQAREVADSIASTTTEVVNSATDWSRLGYSASDALNLAAESAKLAKAGFMDVSTATEEITSSLQAFYGSDIQNGLVSASEAAAEIDDVLVNVGNNLPIDAEGLGAGLERAAGTLVSAGNTLQESAALIATANGTIQNPESVGNALKTTAMRLRGSDSSAISEATGEDVSDDFSDAAQSASELYAEIKKLTAVKSNDFEGISILTETGEYKSTYQILSEIADVWDEINDVSQAALLEDIAGRILPEHIEIYVIKIYLKPVTPKAIPLQYEMK